MKMIYFLLNDTSLRLRTKEVGPTFDTNIGILQEEGLSPILLHHIPGSSVERSQKNVHAHDIAYC